VRIKILIFVVALLILTSQMVFSTTAQKEAGLRLISADQQSVVVELTVDDLAGALEAPATWLGVSSIENLKIEIVEQNQEIINVDTPKISAHELVEINQTGYMRDQAVVQLGFHPVQYDESTGQVTLYRQIVARVSWEQSKNQLPKPQTISPDYEQMLSSMLLNYNALGRSEPVSRRSGVRIGATQADPKTVKIEVSKSGIQKVTYDDLIKAGFNLDNVKRDNLQLTNQGSPVAIYIPGQGSELFTTTDYIIFYGMAMDTLYTDKNIYWLTVSDSAGKRMATRNGTYTGFVPDLADNYLTNLHQETNNYPWYTMPDVSGQNYWFWGAQIVAGKSVDYTIPLNNLSTTATTATMRVHLKGYTDDTKVNPDHHTKIKLNGTEIDAQKWDGQVTFTHVISSVSLVKGNNKVTVEALSTDAAVNQLFVDWIEIDYYNSYVAENNELYFSPPAEGNFKFGITKFSNSEIYLLDITNPDAILLTTPLTDAQGSTYVLKFEEPTLNPIPKTTRYLAAVPQKPSLVLEQTSNLKSSTGADYLIITHADFYTQAMVLANHRQSKGMTVAVIDIQNIYDEFNHGISNPQAIQDFLKYAYGNWKPSPEYVVLVGDGLKDYRCRDKRGCKAGVQAHPIPSNLVTTADGQMSSDSWYVQLSGNDYLADMFIGRISVETTEQATNAIANIIAYEQTPPDATWRKNVLLVADDEVNEFETISNKLASMLSYDYQANKVYATKYGGNEKDIKAEISKYINAGSLLVNYTGHGAVQQWGTNMFEIADIEALQNTNKLPIVTVANCLSGDFAVSSTDALAESFQRLAGKGAVAVWAPSGLGFPDGHRILMDNFYSAVFHDDVHGLGSAIVVAQMNLYKNYQDDTVKDLIQTYLLFGDPAMKIGIDQTDNAPYVTRVYPSNGLVNQPTDVQITISFNKGMVTNTVQLTTVPATSFTPEWNSDYTKVTFSHSGLAYGQPVTLTIQGQDNRGNSLRNDCAPDKCKATTWSFGVMQGAETTIEPTASGTLSHTDTKGRKVQVDVPTGAVSQTTVLKYTVNDDLSNIDVPDAVGPSYALTGYQNNSQVDVKLLKPIKMTVTYDDASVARAAVDEETLILKYYYYGQFQGWVDVAGTCTPESTYIRQPDQNQITVESCVFGQFALFQSSATTATNSIYLPQLVK
jgi:hypothetical protein